MPIRLFAKIQKNGWQKIRNISIIDKKKKRGKYLSTKKVDPNLPALKELSGKPSADEITEEVESVFGEDRALARGVKIYLCHKHTGKMLKEIGRQFDIGASGVSQTSRRIAMKISQDNKLTQVSHPFYLSKPLNGKGQNKILKRNIIP